MQNLGDQFLLNMRNLPDEHVLVYMKALPFACRSEAEQLLVSSSDGPDSKFC